ncbi:50S ribosomal protein L5 [Cuniculiplasma divulgatum]|uniref:Large ribosomal subunit protein uL5 n=1 Tax=Cuniculiplasma divulgatum TaxID=1673428 RepID=A0A1N5VXM5_9ARCH|nr:50S ribosomal protein L5 [Cuniculiplasma divulgatum]EQB68275.1 MAG: 50S ribosomal protein L5P [Thermoplasmatales archaeon Gpl]MCI2412165.1 50S ribosomal protein L5 [Cuniculiplasma sp.]SIM77822.1 50S ribosomal protein L5p [Cuniculiplasma divulgatum]SJK85345.1 50S ribosomal protein L5p [Cuniculiplasma divulgatum]
MKTDNPMREITIDKVVINIGVGQAGDRLNKAVKVIEMLTGHKPVLTTSKKTVREFNLRKGLTIGAKVTLRKADAEKFLKEALYAREYKFPHYSVDKQGNAYFGVSEYTDFKGMKYDPEIGIFGMDVAVVLKRRGGFRNSKRNIRKQNLSSKLFITKEETLKFLKEKFEVEVIN